MSVLQSSNILSLLGMSSKEKGYYYSRCAIERIVKLDVRPKIFDVYSFVAENYSTNPACVERNIRYAVERTWEKGNLKNIYSIFGYTVSPDRGKPTNSEFLFLLADKIKLNNMKDA